jgi:predicted methyltransferase
VKKDMAAVGFVFEAESKALANPDDKHTAQVRDSGVQGRTDQFVLRFRKPR